MNDFFTPLPNDLKLKIFAKLPRHEQVQLARINKNFNAIITTAEDLELKKFKSEHLPSEHSVCRVDHVLVVLEEYEYPYAPRIWLTYENSEPFSPLSIGADDSEKIRLSMKKGSADLLQALREIQFNGFVEKIEKINSEMSNTTQIVSSPQSLQL